MRARHRAWSASLLGALLLAACDRGEPGRLPSDTEILEVEVSLPVSASGTRSVPGTVRSTREAEVATRVSGTVRRVDVDVGDRVEAGAALVRLDDADARAAVRRAEAETERARAYHRRIASLEADGAATAQELDDARAGLAAAEAGLEAVRAQLAYVAIRAPFTGVVTARHVDPGDLAVPGMPVLTLVQPGSVEVEADVPSELTAGLTPGLDVTIRTNEGRSIAATVDRISPAVDPRNRRARVKVRIPDDTATPLAPGTFVRVEISEVGSGGLWVPEDAVVRRGQLTGLFLVDAEHVRLRWVRLGERRMAVDDAASAQVEVLSGLRSGEPVVRRPDPRLTDGARVRAGRVPPQGD